MQIDFENKQLERVLIGVNAAASAMVAATFVLLFGFDTPLFSASILYSAQLFLLFVLIALPKSSSCEITGLKYLF
jgi:ABC-type sulfate transport system permease subunit